MERWCLAYRNGNGVVLVHDGDHTHRQQLFECVRSVEVSCALLIFVSLGLHGGETMYLHLRDPRE